MIKLRRATADDDPDDYLELSLGQAQARLSKQVANDKRRAVVRNTAEIKRAEACFRRTQDGTLKKELRQKIARLENENRETQRFL